MDYNPEVKWTQWEPGYGMIRCGRKGYKELMQWMAEIGRDAMQCVKTADKPHAIYGRKMHDDTGRLVEVRFYCNTYLDDNELEAIARCNPMDTLYVAHKGEE